MSTSWSSQGGSGGLVFLIALAASQTCRADFPRFEALEIDPHVGDVCCYAVTLADVDGDKKTDIVAVTESRVVWYHNPDWKPRVIVANQTERDNVCIAPSRHRRRRQCRFRARGGLAQQQEPRDDVLAVPRQDARRATGTFTPSAAKAGRTACAGEISWARENLNWSSRLSTRRPAPACDCWLSRFPHNPETDPWKSTVLDGDLNAMHNHWMVDLDGDGKTEVSRPARKVYFCSAARRRGKSSSSNWEKGHPGPTSRNSAGAGEVKVGRLKGKSPTSPRSNRCTAMRSSFIPAPRPAKSFGIGTFLTRA